MIVRSKAPVRVDFAGGWTDVDMFARGAGGAVVNATIDKYVTGKIEIFDSTPKGDDSESEGITVSYRSDLPSGCGLGTSSSLNVVWLSLIKSQISSAEDRKMIASLAYDLEAILGILGGKQDQYASALGGFNFMSFGEKVEVEQIAIAPQTVAEMEDRLVLAYTGKPRLSGDIHEHVWGAYRAGVPGTVNALYNLRNVAIRMKSVLENGDLSEFADLLNQNWKHQKELDATITNEQIDELFDETSKSGSIGGKACGAGGGGCVLFIVEPNRRKDVEQVVERLGSRVIPFKFEFEGLQVTQG